MKRSSKFLIAAIICLGVALLVALSVFVNPMPVVSMPVASVPYEPWRPIAFAIFAAAGLFCGGTALLLDIREECYKEVRKAVAEASKSRDK